MTQKTQLLESEFLKVHNTKYLSMKCAVLMHLLFTCITRMIDFGVVCLSTCLSTDSAGQQPTLCALQIHLLMFPTLNVMGHGSWVNSNDPLPALDVSTLTQKQLDASSPNLADGSVLHDKSWSPTVSWGRKAIRILSWILDHFP